MTKTYVDLKLGQVLNIGGTLIRLEKKSGQVARLAIEADPETKISTPTRMSVSQSETMETPHG